MTNNTTNNANININNNITATNYNNTTNNITNNKIIINNIGNENILDLSKKAVMNLFNQGTAKEWTDNVVSKLNTLTNRPIEIRMKPSRFDRVTTKTIQQALADDVHCLITYNSIAATEALMEGRPAISLGPNAASSIF